jgi:hypothetical protein
VYGSGAGAGGRIALQADSISSSLFWSAKGGGCSSFSCGGSAGSVFLRNGTVSSLLLDNRGNANTASTTYTPYPRDLSGVQLGSLSIVANANVAMSSSGSNNDARAFALSMDSSSALSGDVVQLDVRDGQVSGSVTGTAGVQLRNVYSGRGTVQLTGSSRVQCVSCGLAVRLEGSNVSVQGATTVGSMEIRDSHTLQVSGPVTATSMMELNASMNLSISGQITASSPSVTISAERIELGMPSASFTGSGCNVSVVARVAVNVSGSMSCTGFGCNVSVAAPELVRVGGSMSCTTGPCRIVMRSAMLAVRGSVWCGGTSMCLVDVQAGGDASVSGSIAGSDVRVVAAGTVNVSGTISASGRGSPANSGAGKGLPGASGSSSSDSYLLVSGSGGGHGGSGASGCFQVSSSSGSLPAGGVSYGNASAPSTIGSGGGSGCYYYYNCLSSDSSYSQAGGAGGGRIYVNASTIDLSNNSLLSADGSAGVARSVSVNNNGIQYFFGGGGGSGGSIWLAACIISGSGLLTAIGGSSVSGSGGGGGGRIFLQSSSISDFLKSNVTEGNLPPLFRVRDNPVHYFWFYRILRCAGIVKWASTAS